MRTGLLLLLLFSLISFVAVSPIAMGQATPMPSHVISVSALPPLCHGGNATVPSDEVVLINGGIGILYVCSASNTWARVVGSTTYPPAGIAVSNGSGWVGSLTPPASAIVGVSDPQTLSNKSFGSGMVWPTFMIYPSGTGIAVVTGGATWGTTLVPTGNNQCLMSAASSYLTTPPSFRTCPSSGGGATKVVNIPFDQCSPAQSTDAGNSFWTIAPYTNWDAGVWQFAKGTTGNIFCSVRIPNNVDVTPSASIIIDLASADTSGTDTALFKTCDVITTSYNPQVGALTSCASSQNYVSTSTAYANTELTFAVQSVVTANQLLVVEINQASGGETAANINMPPHGPMLRRGDSSP